MPHPDLLIVSGEVDDPTFGVRSSVMIYRLESEKPTYPSILSRRVNGHPIPWSALSGMDTLANGDLIAVWNSVLQREQPFPHQRQEKPSHGH